MKKQKDVQEILRLNGISGYDNLDNVDVIGGYYETFVSYYSGNTAYLVNAGTNTPEELDVITGDTATIATVASGETYFIFESGVTSSTVNGFDITKVGHTVTFSGNTVKVGDTVDALNDNYYTYLGNGNGMLWRILTLGGSGETDITLQSIELSGVSVANLITDIQLSGTGTYSDSSTTNVIDDLTFESSDESIATVSSTGLVDGLSAGTVTITGTYNDPLTSTELTDEYSIEIIGIETLELSGATTANSGDAIQLTGTGTFTDTSEIDLTSDSNITYESSDEAVATVSSGGLITTLTDGNVTITATYSGPLSTETLTDTIEITVS
jgi:hypothetical protein